MSIINLRNLGVTLATPLFSGLSMTVSSGDRIAIVAGNGRGKSTLLKCILGAVEPSEGEVTRERGVTVGMVEQSVPPILAEATFRDAVLQALPRETIDSDSWRADVVLENLGVPEELRERPLRALSGGWQRLALIARVWVSEPDVLLLDEPTNHLDLAKIRFLENWMKAIPRDIPVIVASHDRAFLEAVTNRTLFLRAKNIKLFALPYTKAVAALDEADKAQARQYERDLKTADQLLQQAAKLKNIGINSGSDLLVTKTKQLKERAVRLQDTAKPAHLDKSAGSIRLANRGTHAKVLVTLKDAAVTTPDGTLLFRTGQQYICQGDRVVLLGPNGAGKTRLVSMIERAIAEPSTVIDGITTTPTLAMGYGDQLLADLDDWRTPFETIVNRFDIGDQIARTLLAGAGMTVRMQTQAVRELSGGQKARLGLLVLRLEKPNFYLLDEPTNHLDIEGQEALETELKNHHASCLLVSHDRSFVRRTGNRFWEIKKGKLIEIDSPESFFDSVTHTG